MVGHDDDCDATSGDNGNDRDGAIVSCVGMAYLRRKLGTSCTLGHGERVAVRPSPVSFPTPTSRRAVSLASWLTLLFNRTALYGPVCGVVWEGGAARLLPIPIPRAAKRSVGSQHVKSFEPAKQATEKL